MTRMRKQNLDAPDIAGLVRGAAGGSRRAWERLVDQYDRLICSVTGDFKSVREREREPLGGKFARRLRGPIGGSPVVLSSTRKSSRILIVSQVTVSGVAICIRELVQAAVNGGYQVTVACPSAGDLPAWVRECGVPLTPVTSWPYCGCDGSPGPTT